MNKHECIWYSANKTMRKVLCQQCAADSKPVRVRTDKPKKVRM